MIFNTDIETIIKLAVDGQSEITDGCALYDADNGKMISGAYTTGTVENPSNHLIEVYRIKQGELHGDYQCNDCIYNTEGLEEQKNECCKDAFIDDSIEHFKDNEDFIRENVERQVGELISNVVSSDLEKLNEIRLGLYRVFYSPVQYQEVLMNNNFDILIFDELVSMALECGFILVSSKEFLGDTADYLASYFEGIANDDFSGDEKALAKEIARDLYSYDLDKALDLLTVNFKSSPVKFIVN